MPICKRLWAGAFICMLMTFIMAPYYDNASYYTKLLSSADADTIFEYCFASVNESSAVNELYDDVATNIKYIEFNVCRAALCDAADADISRHGAPNHYRWTELLSVYASVNGGDFDSYNSRKLEKIIYAADAAGGIEKSVSNLKLYRYYLAAYGAVLGGLLGDYTKHNVDGNGNAIETVGYGIRAFSAIAAGYYYNDYDDFGTARSFGYRRRHLGHDMLGSIGTPITAVESGYVECCGWNAYGGWRIGIRSYDGLRYYYYAHLRKGHPYNNIYEGKYVNAGEVIGYLGMTGYSTKENTNNIDTPHLHIGLQVIFSPEQKDGINQIWVDLYALVSFLADKRATTYYDKINKDRFSEVWYIYPEAPD